MSKRSGACLCGKVSFVAAQAGSSVDACHCASCRKWGGSAFMEIDCGDQVSFSNAEDITVYDSSEWAERGFCKHCGSHLFYRLKESQAHMMPVGLFDDDEGLVFRKQVFIEEKPHYYNFTEQTQNLTGAELFALYAPPEEQ